MSYDKKTGKILLTGDDPKEFERDLLKHFEELDRKLSEQPDCSPEILEDLDRLKKINKVNDDIASIDNFVSRARTMKVLQNMKAESTGVNIKSISKPTSIFYVKSFHIMEGKNMAYKMALSLAVCATLISLLFGFFRHDSWAFILALASTPWSAMFIRDQDCALSLFQKPLRRYLFRAFIISFMVVYSVYVVGLTADWAQHSIWLSVIFAYLVAGIYYVARDAIEPVVNQPTYIRSWLKRFLVTLAWPFVVISVLSEWSPSWRAIVKVAVLPILCFSGVLLILRFNQLL